MSASVPVIARRPGWHSPDPIERRDALRRLVKGLAAKHGVDEVKLGRILGYTQSRFARLMSYGERACISLADAALISEHLGEDDELVESLCRARGFRMVRDVGDTHPGGSDLLNAAAAAMRDLSRVVARTAGALPEGIQPDEARAITAELDDVRRRLNAFEAALSCAVEPPMAVSMGVRR